MTSFRSALCLAIVASGPCFVVACGSDDTSSGPDVTPQDAGSDSTSPDAGVEDAASDAAEPDATNDGGDGGIDPRFAALREAIEQERVEDNVPGVAVAVMEGTDVSWAEGFGSKDPDGDDPVLPTTLFRIGSVTKMLTATALLQRVEANEIELQAPITDYLTDFDFAKDASWAPSITVEHLLTHQSAIIDYLEIDDSPVSDDDLASFMGGPFAQSAYLMAPAGRMYNYSNPGYMLAGWVAEKGAPSHYRELLAQRVFSPLDMDRTLFLPSDVIADGDFALGDTLHWETREPLVVAPDTYDNAWCRPAGYAFSSVLDLAKFVAFTIEGDDAVLSDELREQMVQPHVDTQSFLDRLHYGYGWMIQQGVFLGTSFYDIKLLTHGGAIPGYAANVTYVPACGLGFITLANTDGATFPNSLATAILNLCDLPAPSSPPDMTLDSAKLDDYVGQYEDPFNVGAVLVTRNGDDLEVEMPDVDAAGISYGETLIPYIGSTFVLAIQGTQLAVTFIEDEDGRGEYFRSRAFCCGEEWGQCQACAVGPLEACAAAGACHARGAPASVGCADAGTGLCGSGGLSTRPTDKTYQNLLQPKTRRPR